MTTHQIWRTRPLSLGGGAYSVHVQMPRSRQYPLLEHVSLNLETGIEGKPVTYRRHAGTLREEEPTICSLVLVWFVAISGRSRDFDRISIANKGSRRPLLQVTLSPSPPSLNRMNSVNVQHPFLHFTPASMVPVSPGAHGPDPTPAIMTPSGAPASQFRRRILPEGATSFLKGAF